MALSTLLDWIAADFGHRAAEIMAAAEAEAAEVVAEGRKAAEEEFAFRWEETRRLRMQAHQEGLAKRRLATRMRLLTRRREILDGVFAGVVGHLADDEPEAYAAWLVATVCAALATGREGIVLNGRDRRLVGPALLEAALADCRRRSLPPEVTLLSEEGTFAGGAVLRDQARSVDLTLETTIALRRAELEVVLGGMLPGGAR
jgi:vacuolar-type H+-ATPase subunit E/Vma4